MSARASIATGLGRLLFVAAALGTSACATLRVPGLGKSESIDLCQRDQHYLGRAVAVRFIDKYGAVSSPQLTTYVSKVTKLIAGSSDRPESFAGYRAIVLDTDAPVIAGLPGGTVLISKGLLRAIPDEDTLAAAIAGEVGRIADGSAVALLDRSDVEAALSGNGSAESRAAALDASATTVFAELNGNNFGESALIAGDLAAADILDRVGYDVNALDKWLEILAAQTASASAGQRHYAGARLDRHPSSTSPSRASAADVAKRANRFKEALRSAKLGAGPGTGGG